MLILIHFYFFFKQKHYPEDEQCLNIYILLIFDNSTSSAVDSVGSFF